MKKAILALALVMSMGAAQVSWASSAPKHRYHPTAQQVDQQDAQERRQMGSLLRLSRKLLPRMTGRWRLTRIPPVRILPSIMIATMMIPVLIIPSTVWKIMMTRSISSVRCSAAVCWVWWSSFVSSSDCFYPGSADCLHPAYQISGSPP